MLIFLYNVVTRPFCNTSDAAEQKDFLHFIPHSLHSCEKLTQKNYPQSKSTIIQRFKHIVFAPTNMMLR